MTSESVHTSMSTKKFERKIFVYLNYFFYFSHTRIQKKSWFSILNWNKTTTEKKNIIKNWLIVLLGSINVIHIILMVLLICSTVLKRETKMINWFQCFKNKHMYVLINWLHWNFGYFNRMSSNESYRYFWYCVINEFFFMFFSIVINCKINSK